MILIQAMSVLFGIFMLYLVRIHKRKQHLKAFEFGMWVALWILFILAAIFPQSFKGIAERLSIFRIFDLLVVIALMIIIFLTYINMIATKRLDKKIELIVRKKAIDEVTSPSKN